MPDYQTVRDEAGFSWLVGSTQGALRQVAEIPMREFNLKPEACIEANRKERPLLKEMFDDNVQLPSPATPAISYGHVNSLGAELIFQGCLKIREESGDFKPKIEARESKTDWRGELSGMQKPNLDPNLRQN